jgi:hypothetical protein
MASNTTFRKQDGSVVLIERDDHPNLARNLERELQAAKAAYIEGLTASKDWGDFQKRRGQIEGLDIAISLCQRAREKLEA